METFSINRLIQDLLNSVAKTKPEPRDVIWSSDLGKPFIDRWHEMKGIPYSNPATGESLQNFLIGIALEEAFKKQLEICMIPQDKNPKLRIEKEGCLPLICKPDLLLGVNDWNEIEQKIKEMVAHKEAKTEEEFFVYNSDSEERKLVKFPAREYKSRLEERKSSLLELLGYWKEKYPKGFPKTVFEIKTISFFAMKYVTATRGLREMFPHYFLQLYSYMKGLGLEEGRILFIVKGMGKNKGWIEEVRLMQSPEMDEKLWKDIQTISKYYKEDACPPKEQLSSGSMKLNFWVDYSKYKDLIYSEDIEKFRNERG